MKFHPLSWLDALKERLVLTPEEKRVIVFIVVVFILGLAARHYRNNHPETPASIDKKHLAPRAHASASPKRPQRRARLQNRAAKKSPSVDEIKSASE